jgi:hypothetical protein
MSEWTLETLHTHITVILQERDQRYGQRFTDLETALRAALAASEKAINKAENATERRFESVNEFRSTLADQASQFMIRAEALALIERNAERVQDLADRLNQREGHGAGLSAGWGYLIGGLGALATIVTILVVLL